MAADGTSAVYASGLSAPIGLAFDSSGNLFVAYDPTGEITKVDPDGTTSLFASGFSGPNGLAFGPSAAVPEPSQLVMLGGVAFGAAGYARWRRRRPA